jgi:hypothetical protein
MKEPKGMYRYILRGWVPKRPFITKNTKIVAFGSCFAVEVSKWLAAHGMNTHKLEYSKLKLPIVYVEAAFNTSFAILQQLEWVFKGWKPDDHLWWDETRTEVYARAEDRDATKEYVKNADVFIITLGLAEIWENKETGGVFWYAPPKDVFDPEKHVHRLSGVGENYKAIQKIWAILQEYSPGSKVIFTLSPVPLRATFRPMSACTADSVSKATMRVALDLMMSKHPDELNKTLFYWPSYEIVKEYYGGAPAYKPDGRHITQEVIDHIMAEFAQYYIKEEKR